MNIIFDLDGTLIDSKLRLYKLFQHLVSSSDLSYEQYWAFKQKKVSNQTILSTQFGYSDSDVDIFVKEWMELIEHDSFLQFDKPIDGVSNTLDVLQHKADLYVCTARQFKEPALAQLDRLNLLKYFRQVFVTQQKYSKNELILSHVSNLTRDDWFIGDTGHDIQIGKKLNLKTCAVTSGFLSRSSLTEYNPDLMLSSVVDFKLNV